MEKPPHLRPEFAKRFQDPAVALAYLSRPPYPEETFSVLSSLVAGSPRIVLDVGCGTGSIARLIAPLVDEVDAVDFSVPMMETAKALPGGNSPKIAWKLGRIEEVALRPSYSLIVGGQSLHWTDWDVVFPRFRGALARGGFLAVVDLDNEPTPWKAEEDELVKKFSTNPDYRPYPPHDMVADWERSGIFEKRGEKKTAPVPFYHTPEEYTEWLHSRSSLTRGSMGREKAAEFDARVALVLKKHVRGASVESLVFSTIVWGALP